MKKILLSMFTIALVLLLVACGSSDDICPVCEAKVDFANQAFCPNCGHPFGSVKAEGYTDSDGEVYEAEKTETSSDSGEITGAYTLEQAAEKGGIYVKKGSKFYPISNYQFYEMDTNIIYSMENYGYAIAYSDDDQCDMVTLELAEGDLLVTFDSSELFHDRSEYDLFYVSDMCRCYPAQVQGFTSEGIRFKSLYNVDNRQRKKHEVHTCAEINGSIVQEKWKLKNIILKNDCWLVGDIYNQNDSWMLGDYICSFSRNPVSLTGGYYDGTQYKEYNISVGSDMSYITSIINAPVEKTKNGFFIIDTSQLSTGKYLVYSETHDAGLGEPSYKLYSMFNVVTSPHASGMIDSNLIGSWDEYSELTYIENGMSYETDEQYLGLNYTFFEDNKMEMYQYDYGDPYTQLSEEPINVIKITFPYEANGSKLEIFYGLEILHCMNYEIDTSGTRLILTDTETGESAELKRAD